MVGVRGSAPAMRIGTVNIAIIINPNTKAMIILYLSSWLILIDLP